MSDAFLTVREAAAFLRVSVNTMYRLPIPFYRVGADRRYRPSEIEAWLKTRRVG